jgi:hypothetical protein
MRRREFIKQAAITAAAIASTSQLNATAKTPSNPIARRTLGKTGEQLSIIGFGGIVVMNETPGEASNIVAEAFDRGWDRRSHLIAKTAFWLARQKAARRTTRARNLRSRCDC